MDVLCLSIHMCIDLFLDIFHDKSSIATNDFLFFFLIAWYLAEVLFNYINDKVSVIVGKFTNRVEKHTRKCVPGILDFECLCVYYCQ